ncbi:MAG TPA: two-component system sensor histidine kinase KdpD [Casimicrobiaceae bacterium]|nr:two-component system sensor histidine kinase KdpD [Casimicrobiaceae bacterium]
MTDLRRDERPDPDALLARISAEEQRAARGRLKVFFGASPGVGKTFAMLSEAQRLREQGCDVAVGLVETHGRTETARLLAGLDVLPRKRVEYRGNVLEEFDLDAALARKPAVLLLDELAHTNAPGSRHPKRYQDVQELLAAGIDVYTTVNVQHLESLNDIVGGITGVKVRETLPDRIFEEADEVVLVDLTPDDLLQRLKEGKVYFPEQAARAIQNFFRKGNLLALRELALRRTADRVDTQMRTYRTENVARAPVWKTRDSLLVGIGPRVGNEAVVRSAARLAAALEVSWHAVYVETPALARLPEKRRRATLATLKLAQELGAQTATIGAPDPVPALVDYARAHNLGKVVLGREPARRPWYWWRRSPALRLNILAPDLDVILVGRERAQVESSEEGPPESVPDNFMQRYAGALAICAATTLLAFPLQHLFELSNIVMVFLLAVVAVALLFGRGPAVLAAIVNVLAFDFFFVPPQFTFAVSDAQYVFTFAVMLLVGLVVGQLTARLRYQAKFASQGEERARRLFDMARELSAALAPEQVAEIGERFVAATMPGKTAVLMLASNETLQPPPDDETHPQVDMAIARWCVDHGEPAGTGTDTLPAAGKLYLPLKAPVRTRGVLVVEPADGGQLMIPEQRRLLETCAAQIAIAVERVHFVSVAQSTLVDMESERLRNSVLSALSHDLRTPLTALVGLSETLARDLAEGGGTSDGPARALAIREQARRTAQLVDNLLEMARLEAGRVNVRREWQSVEELAGGAIAALEPVLAGRSVAVDLPRDLPLVACDAALIERVLVNLLENATKYTPPGTPIRIGARHVDDVVEVVVEDRGPGLPPGRERAIFEKFTRGEKESAVPGVGLGLAICRAIVEAHGGRIHAENREGGGARFIFTLPAGEAPPAPPETEPGAEPGAPL